MKNNNNNLFDTSMRNKNIEDIYLYHIINKKMKITNNFYLYNEIIKIQIKIVFTYII